jgi:hypothetical protein
MTEGNRALQGILGAFRKKGNQEMDTEGIEEFRRIIHDTVTRADQLYGEGDITAHFEKLRLAETLWRTAVDRLDGGEIKIAATFKRYTVEGGKKIPIVLEASDTPRIKTALAEVDRDVGVTILACREQLLPGIDDVDPEPTIDTEDSGDTDNEWIDTHTGVEAVLKGCEDLRAELLYSPEDNPEEWGREYTKTHIDPPEWWIDPTYPDLRGAIGETDGDELNHRGAFAMGFKAASQRLGIPDCPDFTNCFSDDEADHLSREWGAGHEQYVEQFPDDLWCISADCPLRAYEMGCEAATRGIPITENPWGDSVPNDDPLCAEWFDGWHAGATIAEHSTGKE